MATAVECVQAALAKYETAERSNLVLGELKAILKMVEQPLFNCFQQASVNYRSGLAEKTPSYTQLWCQMATNSLSVIKCLHGVDLPEFYEENLNPLMTEVVQLLKTPNDEDDSQPSECRCVTVRVCGCGCASVWVCDSGVWGSIFCERLVNFCS